MEINGECYIYHEKQDAGLCAVHALNALLQGPYFSEVDLATIAREFDDKERQVMMEMGADTAEFLKYMAEDSGNVAEDGNYSIQVIARALAVWNLTPFPITNPEMKTAKENPLTEETFICNLASHWLTIRKLFGEYWNLNSLLAEPQFLSEFYLSAFLDTLMAKGYTVFVLRGDLPRITNDPESLRDGPWKKVSRKRRAKTQDDDKELEAALEASQLEEALKISMVMSQSSPQTSVPNTPQVAQNEEDDELAQAILLSQQVEHKVNPILEEEPPKGPDASEIVFKMQDGSRVERRFSKTSKVQSLYDFLDTKGISKSKVLLVSTFPKKEYSETFKSLEEVGLHPGGVLIVQNK